MWILFAALSAITAALVAIFGKLGLKQADPTLATTLRAVLMALCLLSVSLALGKLRGLSAATFSGRDWLLLVLAALSGAASWLCYFVALRAGPATAVAAIDRLSIVVVVLLAAVVLGEAWTWRMGLGALLMAGGAVLISWK
jgi:transporter family protein